MHMCWLKLSHTYTWRIWIYVCVCTYNKHTHIRITHVHAYECLYVCTYTYIYIYIYVYVYIERERERERERESTDTFMLITHMRTCAAIFEWAQTRKSHGGSPARGQTQISREERARDERGWRGRLSRYMRMRVCVCACVRVWYVNALTQANAFISTCMHGYTYYTHTHTQVCVCICISIQPFDDPPTHMRIFAHKRISVYSDIHSFISTYLGWYVHILFICTCIYIYVYIYIYIYIPSVIFRTRPCFFPSWNPKNQ